MRKFAKALNYIKISELMRLNFDRDIYKFILQARYRIKYGRAIFCNKRLIRQFNVSLFNLLNRLTNDKTWYKSIFINVQFEISSFLRMLSSNVIIEKKFKRIN